METSAKTERRGRGAAKDAAAVPRPASEAHPLAPRAAGPLLDFLSRVGPKAEQLVSSYRLPPGLAERILAETLQVLVWKWEAVRDREAWLLAVLEGRCRTAGRPAAPVRPGGRQRGAREP